MTPVLAAFGGWHLYIAARGTTTNERDKWKAVGRWLKRQEKEGKEVRAAFTLFSSDARHIPLFSSDAVQRKNRHAGAISCKNPSQTRQVHVYFGILLTVELHLSVSS